MYDVIVTIKCEYELNKKMIDDMIKNKKLFVKDRFSFELYLSTVTKENTLRSMMSIEAYKDKLLNNDLINRRLNNESNSKYNNKEL